MPEASKEEMRLTTENWNSRDCKISVYQREGYMVNVQVRAKMDLAPDEVYDLLINPDNYRFFRNIKAVTYRKVLSDNGRGKQRVEVEHAAGWRFLIFRGLFFTRLFVDQDKRTRIVKFSLAKPGIMKRFQGVWKVQPFNQTTIDSISGYKSNHWDGVTAAIANLRQGNQKPTATLLTLEQSVEPQHRPPQFLEGYVLRISSNLLKCLIDDLKSEIDRINTGNPIPKRQLKKLEKAKKMKKREIEELINKDGKVYGREAVPASLTVGFQGWRPAWFDEVRVLL